VTARIRGCVSFLLYALSTQRALEAARERTQRRPIRYLRFNVAWPVVVEAGKRSSSCTVNGGPRGMVKLTERLSEGSAAQLRFHPPTGSSFDVKRSCGALTEMGWLSSPTTPAPVDHLARAAR
jgi:hypothetical protein